jgi:hypothetical protein
LYLYSDGVNNFKISHDPKLPDPYIISRLVFIRQIKSAVSMVQNRSRVVVVKSLRTNEPHISAYYDLRVIINNFNPWLLTSKLTLRWTLITSALTLVRCCDLEFMAHYTVRTYFTVSLVNSMSRDSYNLPC